MVLKRSVLLSLVLAVGLGACSGDDIGAGLGPGEEKDFNLGGGSGGDLGGGGSGGDGAGGGSGSNLAQTLDCTELDPDVVYVFGALSDSPIEAYALASPDDPQSFCAAFPGFNLPFDTKAVVTGLQRLVYGGTGSSFYEMVPDAITQQDGSWRYPSAAVAEFNDELVFTAVSVSELEQLVAHPTENVFFYKNDETRQIYSSASSDVYYLNPNRHELIGALGDGSLLLFSETTGVVRLDSDLNETALTAPVSGPFDFTDVPAKLSSDGGIWVVAALASAEDEFLRWRVDPADNSIVNEGAYAALPDTYVNVAAARPVMDGDGVLWQLVNNPDGRVVVKRPLVSAGGASQIHYSIDNVSTSWTTETSPDVTPYQLFTGP